LHSVPSRSTRRRALLLGGAAIAAPSARAKAQTAWPARPVRFIVPAAAGDATDVLASLLAPQLSALWRQPVAVDARPDARGIAATEYGRSAAPDGYTLMVATSATFGINPSLFPDLPYNPLIDFLPITGILRMPLVLVARSSLPASTLAQLVVLARRAPATLSYASAGSASIQHLAMELLKLRAGLDVVRRPAKSSEAALADLLSGRAELMMDTAAATVAPILDGRLKALAVTTAQRAAPPLDGVPPVAETLPAFSCAAWCGLAAPAHTPLEIVARVSRDVRAVLEDPEMVRQIEQRGGMPAPATPIQFAEFVKNEIDRWGEVVRATGAKPGN
jgi:tripartite-type tricarboxylate transporter receptor subunit TctC